MTLTGTWLIAATLALGNHQLGITIFILCIALYTVASRASTRKLVAGAIGSLIGMTIVASTKPPDLTTGGAVWIGFMFVAVAVAGYISRRDRERLHTELAEREDSAAAAARRAQLDITTERLHIADELGTVIARAMNTVATHAGTGTQTVSADPDAARTNLEAISTISRDALNDLRQLLKHLRTHTEPAIYQPINPTAALATVGDTT